MPARRIPLGEREIREQLFDRYGGYLTKQDVMRILSVHNRDIVNEWLVGVPGTRIGRRTKYSAAAIARKLWADTES